jgi:hypothetical protein
MTAAAGQMVLAWALVTYGITLVITGSKIAEPLRRLFRFSETASHFLTCPMCVGWWTGFALDFAGLGPLHGSPWTLPLNAFAASALCWTVHVVLARLGAEDL